MNIEYQEINPLGEVEESKKDHRPTITKWKGEPMIRIHSLKATVKEILQVAKVLDVVKVGIVGDPSTGKTTLAMTLGHLIHTMSSKPEFGQIPFAFRVFAEDEFLHLKETLNALEPVNYIIYFHDLSFLTDRKAIEEVKNAITKIRHLKSDVKIILIYDYHYLLGLDKYLRQANFRYLTSLGTSETDNAINLVGTKYAGKIHDFQEKYVEMTTRHKCTFRIGPNKYFSYNYKNPFVPCLFFNNAKLRYVIFPTREWIDPICSICSSSSGKLIHSQVPIGQFKQESDAKFPGLFESAVKLKLFENGLVTYSRPMVAAKRYLDRALEKKIISLDELANAYGLTITKTKLRKKLDGVLSEEQPKNPEVDMIIS